LKYRERKKHMLLDNPEAKKILKVRHRFLIHDHPKAPRQELSELAEKTNPELEADRYGHGDLIAGFESEVAALLGKEAYQNGQEEIVRYIIE
jgi:hypothetical protein